MPVLARAYRANPGNVPTLPILPAEPGTSTQTGHRGGGWGAWGRSPASHPCARVTRARTLPILPVAVDSSGLCVPCGKARGQNDEYLIDDNGYRRRDPMATGDTQITIARIPDLRTVPYRRGLHGMPMAQVTVQIMKHAVNPGEKYGKLTIIWEVRKAAPSEQSYRAVLCRCDCGKELTPALRSLMSGDARSCGCSRGRPKYEWKRCPVCGRLARIRRDRRSCSRACGHKLTGTALRAERPSYDVWHNRVKKARGPANDYRCIDCGGQAEDWSTVDPSSDHVWVRFQPRCRKCHRRYDGAVGEGSPRAKLTAGKVRELRALRADGLTYRQLADEFGISDVSAHAAVNRRTWAHVT